MKTKFALLLLLPFMGFSQIKVLDQIKKKIPTKISTKLPTSTKALSSP